MICHQFIENQEVDANPPKTYDQIQTYLIQD